MRNKKQYEGEEILLTGSVYVYVCIYIYIYMIKKGWSTKRFVFFN